MELSCQKFISELGSKAPVPGGGGASALVGSLGAALGSMVCNLTIGKKAYREVEEEIKGVLAETTALQNELLVLVDRDAEDFKPLAAAYGIKAETPEEKENKARLMEQALKTASGVPLKIVELAHASLKHLDVLAEKGSKLAVSDAGVGAAFARSALVGGKLNVMINANMMKDRAYADEIMARTNRLVEEGTTLADKVYDKVVKRLSV
ncbi:MAG TPA: cyclodeaminase/cyclohydrolase family protein [Bacillota bacterium]